VAPSGKERRRCCSRETVRRQQFGTVLQFYGTASAPAVTPYRIGHMSLSEQTASMTACGETLP
jgi:hypothetical protein